MHTLPQTFNPIQDDRIYIRLKPDHDAYFALIADWYSAEWHIPTDLTIQKLTAIAADKEQFHFLMKVRGDSVATGGIYHHVGILDRVPPLRIYRHWLALLYTRDDERGKGYGAALCQQMTIYAGQIGIKSLSLFTDTAADFYKRQGWEQLDQLTLEGRHLTVMHKNL